MQQLTRFSETIRACALRGSSAVAELVADFSFTRATLAMTLCPSASVCHTRCSIEMDGRIESVLVRKASFDPSYTLF